METICSSETSVDFQRCYIAEDSTLHNHRCENLKSFKFCIVHQFDYISPKTWSEVNPRFLFFKLLEVYDEQWLSFSLFSSHPFVSKFADQDWCDEPEASMHVWDWCAWCELNRRVSEPSNRERHCHLRSNLTPQLVLLNVQCCHHFCTILPSRYMSVEKKKCVCIHL
jgi:hypothetical protein